MCGGMCMCVCMRVCASDCEAMAGKKLMNENILA